MATNSEVAVHEKTAPAAPPPSLHNAVPPVQVQQKKALFDSIAGEPLPPAEEENDPRLKVFFSGVLWVGYAVAIVVALMLIWSAASGLMKTLPR